MDGVTEKRDNNPKEVCHTEMTKWESEYTLWEWRDSGGGGGEGIGEDVERKKWWRGGGGGGVEGRE